MVIPSLFHLACQKTNEQPPDARHMPVEQYAAAEQYFFLESYTVPDCSCSWLNTAYIKWNDLRVRWDIFLRYIVNKCVYAKSNY